MYGYDEFADYMIQELNKNDNIFINGKLRSNGKIEVNYIYKLSY